MGLTITSALALFTLLILSSLTYFASRKIRLPYTVLLVAVGLLLVPLSKLQMFSFLGEFTLTPELLFYLLLPTLIFESAYNINIRRFVENGWSIALLSVASLLISTLAVAGGLFYILGLIGFPIPFMVTLLFGALISATDPVAVLALFKEYGAPRRLALIFEGESLMNDGTAVALFLVVLAVAVSGFHGAESVLEGIYAFSTMVAGGIAFGILMGGLFSKLVEQAQDSEFVSISLTIVSAHLTFILTEILSHNLVIFGQHIPLSPIIATTFAAMVIGNYGRYKISPRAGEFVEKFWGQFAFLANSLVFILIGLLFATLPLTVSVMLVSIALAVVIVAAGRAISIYPIVGMINMLKIEERIPLSWQHLLAWGSLRGALAVTMVLLIPDALTFPGWSYAFTPKEFILALTIGCIYATLFIKATTIGPLMRRLAVDTLTDIESVERAASLALVHATVLERLDSYHEKGYVDGITYEKLRAKHTEGFERAYTASREFSARHEDDRIADRVLRIYAIGIERHFLQELYTYGEVTEPVLKRIMGKLAIQLERFERGQFDINASQYRDKKDIFEILAGKIRLLLFSKRKFETVENNYMYYRAQTIISRKVVKALKDLSILIPEDTVDPKALAQTISLYEEYRTNSRIKMESISVAHTEVIQDLNEILTARGLQKSEEAVINDLYHRKMLTPKLYIDLKEELSLH